jgi:hypothetical protein
MKKINFKNYSIFTDINGSKKANNAGGFEM